MNKNGIILRECQMAFTEAFGNGIVKTALDDAGETIVNTTLVDAGNDSDYDSGT